MVESFPGTMLTYMAAVCEGVQAYARVANVAGAPHSNTMLTALSDPRPAAMLVNAAENTVLPVRRIDAWAQN
jgi:hypothetical protein